MVVARARTLGSTKSRPLRLRGETSLSYITSVLVCIAYHSRMLLRGPKQHRLCWECERPVLGRPAPNACGHTLVEGRIKIKHTRKTTLLILLAWASCGWAQPGAGDQVNSKGQLVQDLSGHRWKLKRMRPGQGVKEGLHELPKGDIETLVWIPAQVPGDVYTDLWKAGALEDPYFGRNSYKAQWVMQDEWWYSLQFNVSEEMKDKVVRLEFDGVDYSCEVWLNGHYLGSHQGVFSRFSFDITKIVQSDRNWFKGRNMLMVKLDPPPQVNHKVAGLKTPWFGDYWRDLVPFGIWRPVRLVATGPARIDDVYVKSSLRQDGTADLDVAVTLENHSEQEKTVVACRHGARPELCRASVQIGNTRR